MLMDLTFNHKGPYKRKVRRSKEEVGDVKREAEVDVTQRKGQQPRNAGGL